MPLRTGPWPAGTPCWVDLTGTDVPLARAFYGTVLGWTWSLGHGGAMPAPPHESPFGRMGTIADPFGATFLVVQTDGSGAPDRGR